MAGWQSALATALQAACIVVAMSWSGHASAAPAPYVLSQVGPGVYAAIDGPEGKSGSNAGFVIGDDGVLVVDSFFDPASTEALVADIHRLTPKPIRYVINTHYHIDHVGGDAVLKREGAVVIAQRNVRGWVRSENAHLFGDRITPALTARITALPLPDVTTEQGLTVWLGARTVGVRFVQGHTGGDLVVRVPDANVVFCGDMVWHHVSPNLIDGTVARWIETVDALRTAPQSDRTVFVPGHGDLAGASDLAQFSAYLRDLLAAAKRARARHLVGEALAKAALPEFARLHGDWIGFDRSAPTELRFMADELAGTKRVPVPVPD